MKRSVLLLALVLPLLAAGCGSTVSHVNGAAAPVAARSASPTTLPPADPPTVLGPDGFGALKLGMTKDRASATGLVDRWPAAAQGCEENTFLTAAKGDVGRVYLDDDEKVQIIEGYPGVRTPEGLAIGASKDELRKAYPGWRNVVDNEPDTAGRGLVAVPGNSKAEYRIVTDGRKVTELALQYRDQTCYE